MLTTSSDTLNILIKIEVYSLIITILFGIIISISSPIFNKLNKSVRSALFPVYNLFSFCDLNGFRDTVALVYLIPGLNVILMMVMSYRLKDSFKTSTGFNIGLLFAPFIFVPALAYSSIDPIDEYSYDKDNESIKNKEEYEVAEVKDIDVDSIFKTESQLQEEAKPYRAKKVKINEDFINSEPAKREKIEKIKK